MSLLLSLSVTFYKLDRDLCSNWYVTTQRVMWVMWQVAQHIKDNWQEYGPFVMAEWNISDRHEYYNYMSLVGTFASELECTVATKLHHMNLSIYRELAGRYELELVFHNRVNANYETARLLFTGCSENGHYDVLLPDYQIYVWDSGQFRKTRCEN